MASFVHSTPITDISRSTHSKDSEKYQVSSTKEDIHVNILFLGETGVGKTTFINAMINYLTTDFHVAKDKGVVKGIPISYIFEDIFGTKFNVEFGSNKMEKNETVVMESEEKSIINRVKTYVLPINGGHVKVRLIDTPGIGDPRGVEQDEINVENIVSYISDLDKIHGICFLVKPEINKNTTYLNYCMYRLLSLFARSAVPNFYFFFTHVKFPNEQTSNAFADLINIVKNIEDNTGIKISVDADKALFIENAAYRYLGAYEKRIEHINYSTLKTSELSWINAGLLCRDLLRCLENKTPYVPKRLLELNLARKSIAMLSNMLSEIRKLVEDNKSSMRKLYDNKKYKVVDVVQNVKSQNSPLLVVCAAEPSCAEIYKIEGVNKMHHKSICHTYDNSDNKFPNVLICDNINKSTFKCDKCGCCFLLHMLVNYTTSLKELPSDEETARIISTNKERLDQFKLNISELEKEYIIIDQFCKKLAIFIRTIAIIPFNYGYKDYVNYLIEQLNSTAAKDAGAKQDLKNLANECEEIERIFKEVLETPSMYNVDFKVNEDTFRSLFQLKHFGRKIYESYQGLTSNSNVQNVMEYHHESDIQKGSTIERDQANECRDEGNTGDTHRYSGNNLQGSKNSEQQVPTNYRSDSGNSDMGPTNNRPGSANSDRTRNNQSALGNSDIPLINNRPVSVNSGAVPRNNRQTSRNNDRSPRRSSGNSDPAPINNQPASVNSDLIAKNKLLGIDLYLKSPKLIEEIVKENSDLTPRNDRLDPGNNGLAPRNNRPDTGNSDMSPKNNPPGSANRDLIPKKKLLEPGWSPSPNVYVKLVNVNSDLAPINNRPDPGNSNMGTSKNLPDSGNSDFSSRIYESVPSQSRNFFHPRNYRPPFANMGPKNKQPGPGYSDLQPRYNRPFSGNHRQTYGNSNLGPSNNNRLDLGISILNARIHELDLKNVFLCPRIIPPDSRNPRIQESHPTNNRPDYGNTYNYTHQNPVNNRPDPGIRSMGLTNVQSYSGYNSMNSRNYVAHPTYNLPIHANIRQESGSSYMDHRIYGSNIQQDYGNRHMYPGAYEPNYNLPNSTMYTTNYGVDPSINQSVPTNNQPYSTYMRLTTHPSIPGCMYYPDPNMGYIHQQPSYYVQQYIPPLMQQAPDCPTAVTTEGVQYEVNYTPTNSGRDNSHTKADNTDREKSEENKNDESSPATSKA